MVSLWNKTNVFCLPTYYGEGMPKSLIEATAAGVPSITTNTPGCNEVIINNLNGKLVPINSPECIAKNILFLIDNKKISIVWDEAENRLHIQKAILEWCLRKI